MPSSARVRSTASTIFFLPSLERWDRPTAASLRASGVHPGRLAQGPEEKSGRAGRMFGFINNLSLAEELRSGGGAWPAAAIIAGRKIVNVDRLPRSGRGAPAQLVVLADQRVLVDRPHLVVVVQHGVDHWRAV